MSKRKIIERYSLADRVLALTAQGKKDYEIAEILNKTDLEGVDTISQPTISRWLKKIRAERGTTSRGIVEEYLKESIPADLKLMDELTQFHLVIFRGKVAASVTGGKPEQIGLSEQRTAARDIHEILKTKMKFIGVDGDPGGTDTGEHPVDLSKYRDDKGDEAVNG